MIALTGETAPANRLCLMRSVMRSARGQSAMVRSGEKQADITAEV